MTGYAVWVEDYCSPPLAQKRAAALDEFFDDLEVTAMDGTQREIIALVLGDAPAVGGGDVCSSRIGMGLGIGI